jgi:hypothetical protein
MVDTLNLNSIKNNIPIIDDDNYSSDSDISFLNQNNSQDGKISIVSENNDQSSSVSDMENIVMQKQSSSVSAVENTVSSKKSISVPAVENTVQPKKSVSVPAVENTVQLRQSVSVPAVENTVQPRQSVLVPAVENTVQPRKSVSVPAVENTVQPRKSVSVPAVENTIQPRQTNIPQLITASVVGASTVSNIINKNGITITPTTVTTKNNNTGLEIKNGLMDGKNKNNTAVNNTDSNDINISKFLNIRGKLISKTSILLICIFIAICGSYIYYHKYHKNKYSKNIENKTN